MSKERPVIAVIDDEEGVRTALRRLLHSAGLAVEVFDSGPAFLAALTGNRPDCAVLDLHMPDMTGFEVLARLADMQIGVPVVAMTGHDAPHAEEIARRFGAAAYLRKPMNDRVLLDAIFTAIAGPANNTPPHP
ncbi:MAG TPA: response regulator [Chthoniobacteraceae bacterium]|jgi:FixJ family two-component response regulator|nr:response regulator [Chthoniobacteraceae bacterium]